MTKLLRTIGAALLASTTSGCFGNEAQYLERSDKVTLSAGNAKEVNAAQHIPDPWPPGVGNRRIPANGDRMVGAVERYQDRGGAREQAGQAAGVTAPPITSSRAVNPRGTLSY